MYPMCYRVVNEIVLDLRRNAPDQLQSIEINLWTEARINCYAGQLARVSIICEYLGLDAAEIGILGNSFTVCAGCQWFT